MTTGPAPVPGTGTAASPTHGGEWIPDTVASRAAALAQAKAAQQAGVAVPTGVGKIMLGTDRQRILGKSLPPITVPAIHLSGTNGKGSTSALLESCLMAAGLKTGRYNSPHLVEPRDTCLFNGQVVSSEEYAENVAFVQAIADKEQLQSTTFEVSTWAFYRMCILRKVDVMIVECGIGGGRDATNILPKEIVLASGLSSVSLDHTAILGDTITEITSDKAQIAVEGGVLVSTPHQNPEATAKAKEVCAEKGALFVQAEQSTEVEAPGPIGLAPFTPPRPPLIRTPLKGSPKGAIETRLPLPGAHQLDNLSLALTILDYIRTDPRALNIQPKLRGLTDEAIQKGVASTQWRGRCSWLTFRGPKRPIPVLVDGAHNFDSSTTLQRYIDTLNLPAGAPRTFVLAMSASIGKSPDGVVRPLLQKGDRVAVPRFTAPVAGMPWITQTDTDKARDTVMPFIGEEGVFYEAKGMGAESVADALRWADEQQKETGFIVLCGSLYLVADAYRLLELQANESSA